MIIGCVVCGIQLGWGCMVRWPLLAETCSYFLLLNTIINPYYHSCGFMTDIYLSISLSTHNGYDTTQKERRFIDQSGIL